MVTFAEPTVTANTANSSKFNSKKFSEKISALNQRLYAFLNSYSNDQNKLDSIGSGDAVAVKGNNWTTVWIPCTSGTSVFSSAVAIDKYVSEQTTLGQLIQWMPTDEEIENFPDENSIIVFAAYDYSKVTQVQEIQELTKKLLNIEDEEEEDVFEPIIKHDHSVTGVSIFSKKSIEFLEKLNELKEKYGIDK